MDGVIRIYEDTAFNSEPAIEIGFTVGKHHHDKFCFELLKLLNEYKTNPNFESFETKLKKKG